MNSVVIQNLTQITKNFEAEKGLFKGPNFETLVFGLKMNPHPLRNFSENSSVLVADLALRERCAKLNLTLFITQR